MTWTLITLLAMVTLFVVLRTVIWQCLLLISSLSRKSITVFNQSKTREDLSAQGSKIRNLFPQASRLLEARLKPGQFSGLTLTLIVIAAIYIAALFGGLVEELMEADELIRLDEWINQRLDSIRTDKMITVFSWITDLGGSTTLIAVSLVTTSLLWAQQRGHLIMPLWMTIAGSQITTYTGKYVLARQRPEFLADVSAITPSFPSGHATSAVAVYGFIAYIVARELMTTRQRFEIIYWAVILIGLVGFSRMYLSLHYTSDVAAGVLVGSFWLLLGFALAEQKRNGLG